MGFNIDRIEKPLGVITMQWVIEDKVDRIIAQGGLANTSIPSIVMSHIDGNPLSSVKRSTRR